MVVFLYFDSLETLFLFKVDECVIFVVHFG